MKKILLFFGDVFWCSWPYSGLVLFSELSKKYDVIPVFYVNDIRTSKIWRGDEKFWFDTSVFQQIPYIEVHNPDSLLSLYRRSGAELLLMSTHMQFKDHLATRNRYLRENGVRICFWDIGGADALYCDSATTGWDFFLSKGHMWKEIMKDSEKFPLSQVKMSENPENIFVTGTPEYDGLSVPPAKEYFFKKYALDPDRPVVAYLPGNPMHDFQYLPELDELHSGLGRLVNMGYQVCFKSHPSDYISTETQHEYYAVHPRANRGGWTGPRYKAPPFNQFNLIYAQDGYDLYQLCDFAVTNYSHVGFELALINKPIVSYKMRDEEQTWHICDNLCELIYTEVRTPDELVDVCTQRNFKPPINDDQLSRFFFFPKEGSAPHMVNAIDEILSRPLEYTLKMRSSATKELGYFHELIDD